MSEPVSNAEIEDVLSSIRRLVSGDVKAPQEDISEETTEPEHPAKLVLTADFRVPDTKAEDAPHEEAQLEEAVVDEEPSASEAEFPEDAPFEFHHTEITDEAEGDDAPEDTNEVWLDPSEAAVASQGDGDDKPSLENTIAELEAAIGQQGGEWEPDGSDFEEDADAEEMMSDPVHDWVDSTAEEVVPQAEMPAEETQEATETEETAEVADDTDDADLFGGDESVIDEETLRDMVSDIVRQELQGALGERITRNVRKLVRREINRVLAAQDFE